MPSDPNDLLKPLRGMYLAQLRERTESVKAFLGHSREGRITDHERAVMQSQAHKLAGSGTTYGFPLITQTARALEEALLDGSAEVARLSNLAESLLHVCEQVLLSVERGGESSLVGIGGANAPDLRPLLLHVDDDPMVADAVSVLLAADFQVLKAADGPEALRLLEKIKPALLLLDEAMPGMSGLELLKTLRANESLRDIPVVMLTASAHAHQVTDAVSAGAVDYLVKPFDPAELASKVRSLALRSGKCVLVADDDAAIRDLLAYKFRLAGLRVLTAADGEEALRLAVRSKPDLAILDRMMPGLDGVAVLQQLRANPETRAIPIMFLTAMRQERDILEGFRLGVADYVIKPFLPEEVLVRGLRLLGLGAEGMA
jgi:DNA-binding response OmpR family regulator/HPt (histidine-containing phosphotransfer) domain-containing protein